MKKFFLILFIGFLLGSTITGLLSPKAISWYFDPPTSIGVSCKEAVEWGIVAYQKTIIAGGLIGLALGVGVAVSSLFQSKNKMNETSQV